MQLNRFSLTLIISKYIFPDNIKYILKNQAKPRDVTISTELRAGVFIRVLFFSLNILLSLATNL